MQLILSSLKEAKCHAARLCCKSVQATCATPAMKTTRTKSGGLTAPSFAMESMRSERRSLLLGAQRQATGRLLPRSPGSILGSFAPTFGGSRRREVGAAMKSEFDSKGMGTSGFVKSCLADHVGSAASEKRGSLGDCCQTRGGGKKGF